jgi:hypothetical protein
MIILQPISTSQTISIMPRDSSVSTVKVYIRRDGDSKVFTELNAPVVVNGNYTEVAFSCDILEENSTYFLELTNGTDLIYRDKIFATSQQDFKIKHKLSEGKYTQYSVTDDNTYLI